MNDRIYIQKLLTTIVMATMVFMSTNTQGQGTESQEAIINAYSENVQVRYARAILRLTEVELQIALTGNEKIANLYSARTVERLRNSVAYAQEMLRYETDRGANDSHKLHLQEVMGALALAESDLAAAVAANEQTPGSVNDLEIMRLRAATEVARLALEKARDPDVTESPMDHLQWQLDRMRFELTRLYVLLDKVSTRN
ncbi:hypothetical protein [Bythopirellula goksoeyrii]|uniref:DUF5667 domain-containing protein n=1 Tax=Bythopirellula goksoeyrii TaxID=1400387 RepID=A0A5B9QP74_9BACT|nr:hypothetical protein [Bythopirellula goksoeyrii]QEG35793.1 hypothetical protein Pr1d_30990 [Bythopirellula goksoeyrii]